MTAIVVLAVVWTSLGHDSIHKVFITEFEQERDKRQNTKNKLDKINSITD